ncbi:MAG: OsmC family peroxiredoxin [Deltaproteobacteria bacterium]|nr:MAG: OsmC family peroxiredoxin [Deltaproteobacteria bacterium]TMQ20329.1 MAG: OsmC family peroxiredoxin [Deltaproteobacteria bacterium]
MDRGAIAGWDGAKVKCGTVTTDSGSLIGVPYSPVTRFEREAGPPATTPEELLAAAYASCFTMTFAQQLTAAGHTASSLRTEVRVQLVKPHGYWEIPAIRVHCSAAVRGITESEFLKIAHAARMSGPIARALRSEITLTVSLDRAPGREWQLPLGPPVERETSAHL